MHAYMTVNADYSINEGIDAYVTLRVAGRNTTEYAFSVVDLATKAGFEELVESYEGLMGPVVDLAEFRIGLKIKIAKAIMRLEQRIYELHECDTKLYGVDLPLEAYGLALKKAVADLLNTVAYTLHEEGESYELFVGLARYVAAKTALHDVLGDDPYELGEIYELSKEILDTVSPETIGGVEKRAAAIGAQLLSEKAEAAFLLTSDEEYEFLECWGIL